MLRFLPELHLSTWETWKVNSRSYSYFHDLYMLFLNKWNVYLNESRFSIEAECQEGVEFWNFSQHQSETRKTLRFQKRASFRSALVIQIPPYLRKERNVENKNRFNTGKWSHLSQEKILTKGKLRTLLMYRYTDNPFQEIGF